MCLLSHYDHLSTSCQNRVSSCIGPYSHQCCTFSRPCIQVNSHMKRNIMPKRFLESRYYELTRIFIALATCLLFAPLAISARCAYHSWRLRSLISRLAPTDELVHAPKNTNCEADSRKNAEPTDASVGISVAFKNLHYWPQRPQERSIDDRGCVLLVTGLLHHV